MKIVKSFFILLVVLSSDMSFALVDEPKTSPRYYSDQLETVMTLGPYQPIGVSVSSDNRLFVSFPNRQKAYEYGLAEIIDGKKQPFPNAYWHEKTEKSDAHFMNVQDISIDANDNLWVLDSMPASQNNLLGGGEDQEIEGYFKLVQFDIKKGEVKEIYHFEDLDKTRSALNDVRIDTKRNKAYLSDPGQAAIVVLDLETGKSRSVLMNSTFTKAKEGIILAYEGKEMRNSKGQPFVSHVNGIALSKDNEYFYFKPINDYHLYRIATEKLADASLNDHRLKTFVEDLGEVGITHGLLEGPQGEVYLTTSMDYSISYITEDGKIHQLVQDSRLLWPDSLGIGQDGYLYFSCAQLQRDAFWNQGVDKTAYPYAIYRVKIPHLKGPKK